MPLHSASARESTFDVVGNLAPDLAFKILKLLSVKELVGVESVRWFHCRLILDWITQPTALVGFQKMARNGTPSFALEVPLSQIDIDRPDACQNSTKS